MSKELTPFEVSKQLKDFVLGFVKNGLDRRFVRGSFDIIENALKKIDDENHCVIDIRVFTPVDTDVFEQLKKEHKVLEIIKEKEVDIYGIKNSIDVYDYNAGIENESNFEKRLLIQEEYDLLKEVLL